MMTRLFEVKKLRRASIAVGVVMVGLLFGVLIAKLEAKLPGLAQRNPVEGGASKSEVRSEALLSEAGGSESSNLRRVCDGGACSGGERRDFSTNVSVGVVQNHGSVTSRELKVRLQEVLKQLPRKDQVTAKDAHHFSGRLIVSAERLAALSNIHVARGSKESEMILQFYKTCAKEARLLTSFRALCLLKVRDFSESTALAKWEDEAQIPFEVRSLAQEL